MLAVNGQFHTVIVTILDMIWNKFALSYWNKNGRKHDCHGFSVYTTKSCFSLRMPFISSTTACCQSQHCHRTFHRALSILVMSQQLWAECTEQYQEGCIRNRPLCECGTFNGTLCLFLMTTLCVTPNLK